MKQTSILDTEPTTELCTVLPTVKKASMHEPNIELLNMDCLHYMKQCEDKQFDLAIVDPPYGIGEDGKKNHSRGKLAKATKYTPKNWDKHTPTQEYFDELKRISKNQIVWGGNYFIDKIKQPSMGWVFWDKNMTGDFSDGELAYTSFNKALKKVTYTWNGMLQGDMKNKEVRIHPTQKPKALYEWLLMNYAEEGNKIIDTHLGSGSIALACWNMKFDLVGIEIDKEYFDNANNRLNQYKKQLTLF